MSYVAVTPEVYAPPALPERPFLDSVRSIASTAVQAITSLPEFAMQGSLRSFADGIAYNDSQPASAEGSSDEPNKPKVTVIPPVDPEVVRQNDKAGWPEAIKPRGTPVGEDPGQRKTTNKPRHN